MPNIPWWNSAGIKYNPSEICKYMLMPGRIYTGNGLDAAG